MYLGTLNLRKCLVKLKELVTLLLWCWATHHAADVKARMDAR